MHAGHPQVIQEPAFPAPSLAEVAWSWVVVLLASSGLGLLYKVTTVDPGFVPIGEAAERETKSLSRVAGASGERYDHYRALNSAALWAGNWNQLCVSCKIGP
jgi:palmitoyltransferase ZDHHC13/17